MLQIIAVAGARFTRVEPDSRSGLDFIPATCCGLVTAHRLEHCVNDLLLLRELLRVYRIILGGFNRLLDKRVVGPLDDESSFQRWVVLSLRIDPGRKDTLSPLGVGKLFCNQMLLVMSSVVLQL